MQKLSEVMISSSICKLYTAQEDIHKLESGAEESTYHHRAAFNGANLTRNTLLILLIHPCELFVVTQNACNLAPSQKLVCHQRLRPLLVSPPRTAYSHSGRRTKRKNRSADHPTPRWMMRQYSSTNAIAPLQ